MSTFLRFALSAVLLFPLLPRAAELVVLVDTATEMPMARFERYRLVDGMHKDIGLALAAQLQRTPRFLALPRKRVVAALAAGQADILCGYVPEWLPGPFKWSTPFMPIVEVLVSSRNARRPASVAELAGQPIGTVLGWAHPELEQILGKGFVREDGPNTETNLRKLAAGRVQHAVTERSFLDYHMRRGDIALKIHPPLAVKSWLGQCAISPRSQLGAADVDRALAAMARDGTTAAVMARYR
jgi:polar amino acid transport system substrate-binding protein